MIHGYEVRVTELKGIPTYPDAYDLNDFENGHPEWTSDEVKDAIAESLELLCDRLGIPTTHDKHYDASLALERIFGYDIPVDASL